MIDFQCYIHFSMFSHFCCEHWHCYEIQDSANKVVIQLIDRIHFQWQISIDLLKFEDLKLTDDNTLPFRIVGPPTPFFRKFATRKFRTTFLAELLHFRSIPKVIWEFGQYFDFGPSWGSKVMTKLNEKSLSYVFGPPKMAQIQKISQIPK